MNVLITSVSKKTILVNLFREALYTIHPYGIVVGVDINEDAIGLKFCDKFYKVCGLTDENYLNQITEICLKEDIKLIIPTRDPELLFFSKHKDYFNTKNILICISNYETIEICNNKKKFIEFCKKNNFPIPKTFNNSSDIDKYPIFIKPINGQASQDTHIIFEPTFINNDKYIIQEFINWDEYTIDYLGNFEGEYIACIPRKRIQISNGESQITEVFRNTDIENLCKELGNKLKLIGHCNIQCFYNGEIKLIEINPRFGGASHLGIRAGLDSPKNLINMCLKKNIIINNILQLKMYKYTQDIFFNFEEQNKIYCIDIDGTLCTEGEEYHLSKPIKKTIDKINKLYNNNTIKLYTARGSKSHTDWRKFTEKQLKFWGVNYHELIMNKPYADYYIDNKAINIYEWI